MPTIKDTAATSALNEDQYINTLYDQTHAAQEQTIRDNYDASSQQLTASQQASQSLTDAYQGRTQAENPGGTNGSYIPLSSGTAAGQRTQMNLSFGNQNQSNAAQLNQQQQQIDQEYERQRQLLADQYSTAIKQAQADNDMARAQQLYEAAKAEEAQLRALRQQGADLLAARGDMSLWETLVGGSGAGTDAASGLPSGWVPERDTSSATWDGVTRNEDAVNAIYDAMLESQRLQAQSERDAALSDLQASQQARQRQTDQSLTQAYVDALRSGRNYQEVQNAYGQGSGVAAQAQIARANQLTGELTDLRAQQMAADSQAELDRLGLIRAYGDQMAAATADVNQQRADALYAAAADEQQALMDLQQSYGSALAQNGDYSVLGALYGLTPEQIAKLQTPTGGGGGGGGGGGSSSRRKSSSSTSGTVSNTAANPSILDLGYGPISSETLVGLVNSGEVIPTVNDNGGITYHKNPHYEASQFMFTKLLKP